MTSFFKFAANIKNSDSHDQNDEISNTLKLPWTICEPIFKACGSCYYSKYTGLLAMEKAIIVSLLKKSVFKSTFSTN